MMEMPDLFLCSPRVCWIFRPHFVSSTLKHGSMNWVTEVQT